MATIKRVAYTYNSVLEDQGQEAYFLDVAVWEDSTSLVDVCEKFKTKEEFMAKIQEILPLLEEVSL